MLKLCILMVAEKQFLNLILGEKKVPTTILALDQPSIGTWGAVWMIGM